MDQSEADWGDWSLNNEAGDVVTVSETTVLGEDDSGVGEKAGQVPSMSDDGESAEEKKSGFVASQGLHDDENGLENQLYEDYNGTESISAWEGDSDREEGVEEVPSVITRVDQEGKLGLVRCEYCGRPGVRDAFYSKSKRFCSRACCSSFSKLAPQPSNAGIENKRPMHKGYGNKNKIHVQNPMLKSGVIRSFMWNDYLQPNVHAAPVSCFKHCPLSASWDNMTVGMKLEVINVHTRVQSPNNVYWIATVLRLEGYRALMRYEGFGQDSSLDFWVNLCSKDVHPVGWCAGNGKPLVPPKVIENKYADWRELLVRRLTGARTLPHNFGELVEDGLKSWPLVLSMRLEVVDKMCVSAMRVATVQHAVCGRVRLQYESEANYDNDTFWCHSYSPLIHPVGWSQLVGHRLHASSDYKGESLSKAALKKYSPTDATPDMFPKMREPPQVNGLKFQANMKLEAIDPLNLSTICVATVMKVLRNNYLMIGIDGSMADDGSDWFCYHSTSPCIFPVGFCELNRIKLTPPKGFKGPFRWIDYLRHTKAAAAPVKLFEKEIPNHGFKVGTKLETVDLMEPRLICVSSVSRIVGRLLRIHFDGWDESYDQWIDCGSPDIYPVGWCEMVGYHLEGPRPKEVLPPSPMVTVAPGTVVPKKRRSKTQMYRGPRKKRKSKVTGGVTVSPGSHALLTPQSSIDSQQSDPLPWEEDTDIHAADTHLDSQTLTHRSEVKAAGVMMSCKQEPGAEIVASRPGEGSKESSVTAPVHPRSKPAEGSTVQTSTQPLSVVISSTNTTALPAAAAARSARVQQQGQGDTLGSTLSSPGGGLASSLPSIATMLNSPVKPSTHLSPPVLSPKGKQQQVVAQQTTAESVGSGGLLPLSSLVPGEGGDSSRGGGVMRMLSHHIPRVVAGEAEDGGGEGGRLTISSAQPVAPHLWSVFDVCQFLRINDCGAHCDSFRKKTIDGKALMALSKEQIVNLTGMNVGPSLKIYDLIQALKIRLAQQQQQQQAAQQGGPGYSPGGSSTSRFLSPGSQLKHSSALQAQLTKQLS